MRVRKCASLLLGALLCLGAARVEAASARFTPTVNLGYHYNDNIRATDSEMVEPIAAQWLDYLLGLDTSVKSRSFSATLNGSAGYSQYVTSSDDLEKLTDYRSYNLNYVNLALEGGLQYLTSSQAFELNDRVTRSRDFSEIFGIQNSDFSDFQLYTHNVASAQWRFRTRSPFNGLFRYDYETIIFDKPTGDLVSEPPDSYAHKGYAKFTYRAGPKSEIGLDLQGGERVYGDAVFRSAGGFERVADIVDYDYYQAMIVFNYKISPSASLSGGGGALYRTFFGQPEAGPELKDYLLPIVNIAYRQGVKYRYELGLSGEYGANTYGLNSYFSYIQGGASLKYYLGRALCLNANLIYKNDAYDKENLDVGDVWKNDRVDNLYLGLVGLTWEVLRRAETPYLSLSAQYQYMQRDSNIDGEISDFLPGSTPLLASYDTTVNMAIVSLIFNPTVAIGPR